MLQTGANGTWYINTSAWLQLRPPIHRSNHAARLLRCLAVAVHDAVAAHAARSRPLSSPTSATGDAPPPPPARAVQARPGRPARPLLSPARRRVYTLCPVNPPYSPPLILYVHILLGYHVQIDRLCIIYAAICDFLK